MRVVTWQDTSSLTSLPHALAGEWPGHGHDWIVHQRVDAGGTLARGALESPDPAVIPAPSGIMLALVGLAVIAIRRGTR